MPANWENSAVATVLEKVSFHSNPKERQCQRREASWPVCTGSHHLGSIVVFAASVSLTRLSLGDHWLFPPGWAGGVCLADAHPHPDPRVSSKPAHGVQSTLQSEPKTVSTCCWGESRFMGTRRVGRELGSLSPQQGPSFPSSSAGS